MAGRNKKDPLTEAKGKPLKAVDIWLAREEDNIDWYLKQADKAISEAMDFLKEPVREMNQ